MLLSTSVRRILSPPHELFDIHQWTLNTIGRYLRKQLDLESIYDAFENIKAEYDFFHH